MASCAIRLLGPPQVSLDRGLVSDLSSDKALALLAYLAVESDRAHRREKLAGMLWPEYTESSARANLRRALADLRRAIGDHQATPPYLHTTRQTIQFNAASEAWIDVTAFSTLLEPAKAAGPPSLEQLEEAVELYRGPFLEGFSLADSADFEEWLLLTREQLRRQGIKLLDRLAVAYEGQGNYARALQHAWRQLELDPWRENAHRQAMRLLALDGQRDAALAQYATCRRLLQAELGVEPSQATQALYQQLLNEEWPASVAAEAVPLARELGAVGECPYRGLGAFGEQDASFFFGRGVFTALLWDAVRQKPFVSVIVGASGSGKSSAIFAGLAPRLRREGGDWLIAHCRPGGQPFRALSAALLPGLEPDSDETERLLQARKLAVALAEGDLPLGEVVERVLVQHSQKRRLLLIIDQLEELYTLCPESARRQSFLDLLLSAVEAGEGEQGSPLVLLLSLRADFMGQALAYRPFADVLQDGALILGPMSRDELRATIEKPAEKQGAAFEPGLVDRILDDVGKEPGNLPLLEFALTLLWEQADTGWLTHETYEALGRVEGALARHAEQVFGKLDPDKQQRLPQILTQLVQPGEGTEDTRRVATRAQVGEANWPLTRHLADKRLVVTGQDATGNEIVEVAHEALIQNWQRLQGWLQADRAFRVWQERLRAALRQWQASAGDDGALLRGAPLAQAEEWLVTRGAELSQPELEFVRASVSLRERQAADRQARQQRQLATERRARRIFGVLAGVLAVATVIALVLAFFSAQQRRQALEAYSLSLAANAREALTDLDSTTALTLALAANRIDNPPAKAQRLLMEAAYAPGARWRATVGTLFPGAEGPVTALAISPDGRSALAGLAGGSVILWDLESKEEIARLDGHEARVNDVVFGPGGSMALSGGDDAQVIVWDLDTGEEVRRLDGHSGVVRSVDISPDGQRAVSGGFSGAFVTDPGELIVWELGTGTEVRRLEGHVAGVVAAEFTPDGDGLLACSGDAQIFSDQGIEMPFDLILWDADSGESIWASADMEDDVYTLSISPDGTQALTGSYYNNRVTLWDLETGEGTGKFDRHSTGVSTVAFAPDGRRAVSGSYDDSLILWDLSTGHPLQQFGGHDSDVLALAISPDGRTTLSASQGGELILSDLTDAAEIGRLAGHGDMVYDLAFTPDGKRALSSSGSAGPGVPLRDASIRLWDVETATQLHARDLGLPDGVVFQVAVSPDGRTALVASVEPFIRVWDLESWQEIGRLEGHAGWATGIEFTPDGDRALSCSVDGTLILWDVPRRQAIHRFDGHGEGLWSLAISPDGRTAVSDSGDSSMALWDLESGQEIRNFVRADLTGDTGSSGQAFLPDGRTAISCEVDGSLIEWDLATGEEIRRLGQHTGLRTRVIVSPDGRLALTSSMDGTLMLWDLESGELIRRSVGHGTIFDLALAPDGESVAFGSSDTTITRWRFEDPSLQALKAWVADNRYLPELTCEEREMYQIEPLCDNTGTQQAPQP